MGPDLGWIKRAQACGMSDDDIQAYLDAFAMPVPTLDPRENKKAYDRERMRVKRTEVARCRTTVVEQRKISPHPSKEITIPTSSVIETSEVAPLSLVFPSKQDLEWAVAEWNELAEDTGLPAVKALNAQRRRSLTHRLRELGHREAWTDALMLVARSPFCCGENDRGWRANFDFVLQPSSMAKLLEGNYGKIQGREGQR